MYDVGNRLSSIDLPVPDGPSTGARPPGLSARVTRTPATTRETLRRTPMHKSSSSQDRCPDVGIPHDAAERFIAAESGCGTIEELRLLLAFKRT